MKFRRIFFLIAGLLTLSAALWAGDSASFVDLGFSQDGSHYMFAQFGVQVNTLRPWADLFIVDVARNDFVPGGRIAHVHDSPIRPGQDGAGVMHRLIAQNSALATRYGISFNQGQPLYIALDGDPAYAGDPISFRDFISGISYRATLVESFFGSGQNLQSSFYISLESTDPRNERRNFTIGTPSLRRSLITSYRIKEVLVAPTGNSLIFVIEMQRLAGNTHDIRYMVEALRM